MIMHRKLARLGAVTALAAGAYLGITVPAGAAVTAVTGSTYIANHPDGGHGTPSTWAYDNFRRTLTVTLAATSDCTAMSGFNASTDNCYMAHISDSGKFDAITGAGTPNGTGGQIRHAVQGVMTGSYDLTVYAPAADTLSAAGIPGYRNDNFGAPAVTTTNWPTLAFTAPADAVTAGGDYSWKYTDTCEQWTDSSANGDGTAAGAGNITGATVCVTHVAGPGPVKNANSGKCLNVVNGLYATGGLLNQYTCGAMWHGKVGGAQQTEYVQRSDGTGYLLVISPDNGSKWLVTSSIKGAQLSLKPYYTAAADVVFSNGYYKFVNTGLVADVQGYSKANLAVVHGWTVNQPPTLNQVWTLP